MGIIKKVKLICTIVVSVLFISIAGFMLSIPVVNDCVANKTAKYVERIELPNNTHYIETFAKAVHDIVSNTVQVFENQDIEAAKHIEPLEQVIDGLNLEIKQRHINRLRKGRCTIETGLILEDIMTNFERVSDHCSNIAVCMIEVRDNGFETHGYLEHLTNEDNPQFAKECRQYYKQYQLPELKKVD